MARNKSSQSNKPRACEIGLKVESWFWLVTALAAAIYATGWLLPIAKYIPGFNFFHGPGRYGIVTSFGIAMLAGRGLDRVLRGQEGLVRWAVIGVAFYSTTADLLMVSRMVYYAQMVRRPPIRFLDESPIRQAFAAEKDLARLYAPFQNAFNLLGVSCVPVYLGIAPAEYSDKNFAGATSPKPLDETRPIPADPVFSKWLRERGVTHILSFYPLENASWKTSLIWSGVDPFVNRTLGRMEPVFLSRFNDPPGRAELRYRDPYKTPEAISVPFQRDANRISFPVKSNEPAEVILKDLAYPGWTVSIDDQSAVITSKGQFRSVEVPAGEHRVTFAYRPNSVWLGLLISLTTAFVLAAIGHVRFWHFAWTEQLLTRLERPKSSPPSSGNPQTK